MSGKLVSAFFTTNGVPSDILSPTIKIWEVTSSSNILVVNNANMALVGDGFYKYEFAAMDPLKDYLFRADSGASQSADERYCIGSSMLSKEEISDTVWDEDTSEHNIANSAGEKVNIMKTEITDMSGLLEILLKYQANRTRIDPVSKTLTVYEDDGTTPMKVFSMRNVAGVPSTSQVAERYPL